MAGTPMTVPPGSLATTGDLQAGANLSSGGSFTFGTAMGSNPADFIAGHTGNVRFTIPSAGILNFKTSSANLFQINNGGLNTSFVPLQLAPTSLNVAGTGAAAAAKVALFGSTGTISGTMTGGVVAPLNYLTNGADTATCTNNAGSLALLQLQHNIGNAAASGGRVGLQIIDTFTHASNSKAQGLTGAFYGALYPVIQAQAGDGGTDLTTTGSYGDFYAINPVAHAFSAAHFLHALNGMEIDIAADAGSSLRFKTGASIVQLPTDAVAAGAPEGDGGIMFANASGASGWRDFGIAFGFSYSQFPFRSTATLLKSYPDVEGTLSPVTWGADFRFSTFPATGNPADGGLLRGNGVTIDGGTPAGYATVQLGSAYLSSSPTGLAIDAKGAVGVSAAVVAGGSGWVNGALATDPYGGVWAVTATAGAATAWALKRAPVYPSATPPANPVTLTAFGSASVDAGATGATVNITWTTSGTGLSLNPTGRHIGFNGAVPQAVPTVSGSISGGQALKSLVSALAAYGLIIDGTSA